MRRVVITFAVFALAWPLVALVLRGAFGPAGALTLAGVTLLATVALGIPAFLFLCRRRWLEVWHFACGGALIGVLCVVPFGAVGTALVAALLPTFAILGVVHGALFWLLAVWRNADLVERCGRHAG
jgi:hypothetical protein